MYLPGPHSILCVHVPLAHRITGPSLVTSPPWHLYSTVELWSTNALWRPLISVALGITGTSHWPERTDTSRFKTIHITMHVPLHYWVHELFKNPYDKASFNVDNSSVEKVKGETKSCFCIRFVYIIIMVI